VRPHPIREADWAVAVSLLQGADEVCLAAHIHPDGDSLGSALALGLALRGLGKRLLAARLLEAGVRQDVVARHLWDSVPFGYLKLLATALDGARLEPEAVGGLGLVWTVVSRADRQRHGLAPDAAEGVIDIVRKAEEAEVAAVFRQDDKGLYQVSVRSHGRVDVGAVCGQLGGGGHRFAAGFTAHDSVPSALAALRRFLAAAPHLPV
jgi:bifunctional oligoribonuclease and PAP phosphatase NrnA